MSGNCTETFKSCVSDTEEKTQNPLSSMISCICCFETNSSFITLKSCSHSDFFDYFEKPEIDPSRQVVCQLCHGMLTKIKLFKHQVEDSFKLLSNADLYNANKTKVSNEAITPKRKLSMSDLTQIEINEKILLITKHPNRTKVNKTVPKEFTFKVKNIKNQKFIEIGNILNIPESIGKLKDISSLHIPKYVPEIIENQNKVLPIEYIKDSSVKTFNRELNNVAEDAPLKLIEIKTEPNVCRDMLPEEESKEELVLEIDIKEEEIQETAQHTESAEKISDRKRTFTGATIKKQKKKQHSESAEKRSAHKKISTKKKKSNYKDDTPKKCDSCPSVYKKLDSLRKHQLRKHGVEHLYACDICNSSFLIKSSLEKHILNHDADADKVKKLSYCTTCKMQFKNLKYYELHMTKSAKHAKKAFSCSECQKEFTTKIYRDRHYKFYHLEQTNYKCEECNKMFMTKWKLKDHNRTHHNLERPRRFTCFVCEKQFFTEKVLRDHALIHSEVRSFMCPQCGDTFKQRASLYTHIRLVHKKIPRNKKEKDGNEMSKTIVEQESAI